MKRIALALALAVAAALPSAAQARLAVNQCIGPAGTRMFTDRPCDGVGTVHVAGRDALERRRPGRSAVPSIARENERSRFGVGCPARSPQTLLGAVRAALESGNVNELAGLYDWNGMSHGRAMEQMRRLTKIAERAPLEVTLESGAPSVDYAVTERDGVRVYEAVPPTPGLPSMRIDQFAGDDLLDSTRFPITRGAGCVWLGFND
jgi:hypothetical protein